ncbi:hypothetical protein DXG03_008636 [Asterophora parasitica]|uniref:HTH La-type RNA-binding domain-containing protein n=1 Tax=Asterophora parasitica TaxID=117018 RepID=A0A9P7KCN1_9AGAR|nr:hypothetical protein DXG03_008636 [Asterophora parasitica]
MVSPSTSSLPKNPPLSYADRAKKAQSIRSPISHHTHVQFTTSAVVSCLSPPDLSNSSSTYKPVEVAPKVLEHKPTPPPGPSTTDSSKTQTHHTPHSTSTPRTSSDLATKALSIVVAHTDAPKVPAVNVWSLRMEQMAARATPSQPPPQSQLPASQSMPIPPKSALSLDKPHQSQAQSSNLSAANVHGLMSTVPVHHDPFIVRTNINPARPVTAIDTESWPEVGKSIPLTATASEHHGSGSGSPTSAAPAIETNSAGTNASRKSEKSKSKWVPIPPSELQAAADALAPATKSRSRHNSESRKQPRSNSGANFSSPNPITGHGSSQSRIQSGAQSRSESLQSSPRFPRGRRLPEEITSANGYPLRQVQGAPSSGSASTSGAVVDVNANGSLDTPEATYPSSVYTHGQIQSSSPQNAAANVAPPSTPPQAHPHLDPAFNVHNPNQPIPPPQVKPGQFPLPPPHMQMHPLPTRPNFVSHSTHHGYNSHGPSPGGTPPLPHPSGPYPHHPHHLLGPPPMVGMGPAPYPPYPIYTPYDPHAHPHPQPQYGFYPPSGSGHHSPVYTPRPPPHHGAGAPHFVPYPPRGYEHRGVPPGHLPPHVPGYGERVTEMHASEIEGLERAGEGETGNIARDATTSPPHARPPPPKLSLPVAGYRPAAAAVPSPPAHIAPSGVAGGSNGRVVFGSIGVSGTNTCPSPALFPNGVGVTHDEQGGGNTEGNNEEKTFTKYSIGVAPGEGLKTQSQSQSGKRSRAEENRIKEADAPETKVIDLTLTDYKTRDAKWEFGTATSTTITTSEATVRSIAPDAPVTEEGNGVKEPKTLPPILSSITGFELPLQTSFALTASSPRQLQMRLQQLSGTAREDTDAPGGDADPFEVKDYGYGFGLGSRSHGSMSPPHANGAGVQVQGQEKSGNGSAESERDNEKDAGARDPRYRDKRDLEVPVRSKRGYHSGGGGYGGEGRGGYGNRRGRGMNGYGRGYGRGRGGGGGFQPPHHHQNRGAPPFPVTPPSGPGFHLMVNSSMLGAGPGDMNGFYAPHPQQRPNLNLTTTYIPTGFENYGPPIPPAPPSQQQQLGAPSHPTPPVPVPVSHISFPLDPTRWYLLGQLEYYLSPQNMAQDFFLRRQMNSRGWVPISLIASFNRVRQLTMDYQLVRDVLMLSSVVNVQDEWVRMTSWEQFVLPDAAPSSVERGSEVETHSRGYHGEHFSRQGGNESSAPTMQGDEPDAEGEGEVYDDEEEDVVFVMTREEAAGAIV